MSKKVENVVEVGEQDFEGAANVAVVEANNADTPEPEKKKLSKKGFIGIVAAGVAGVALTTIAVVRSFKSNSKDDDYQDCRVQEDEEE